MPSQIAMTSSFIALKLALAYQNGVRTDWVLLLVGALLAYTIASSKIVSSYLTYLNFTPKEQVNNFRITNTMFDVDTI